MSPSESPLPGLDAFLPKQSAAKPDKKKIIKVSVGAVSVPIYPLKNKAGEVTRYCIVYRPGKKAGRVRVTKVRLADAKKAAERICLDIARGQVRAGRLTTDQLLQAAEALEIIEPRGWTLDGLAREAEAAVQSAGGTSLAEMARFWARHHQASMSKRTVGEIHADLLDTKRDHGLSRRYWRGLDQDLGKFCAAFQGKVAGEITAAEILEYLRTLKVEWRRRNNVHSHIVTLFRFAKSEGHLPADRNTEAEKVSKLPKPRNAPPPRIFTPAEMRVVLANVEPEWLPWIALGGFAGLRTAEIERLDWGDVLFADALVHIREEVAKRTSRKIGDARYVPMPENLLAWLQPWRTATGSVCPHRRSDRLTGKLGKFLPGGVWGQNPLRHSWISYRAAETANLPQVADEAGNSTEISRTAYRNPRMKREAVAWFSIFPDVVAAANVVQMVS